MTRLRYLDTRKASAKCARSVLFEEIGIMDLIGQYDTIRKCWSSPAAVPGHLFSKMRTTRSFRKVPTMRQTQRIEQVHEHGLPEVMHVRMARRQPRGTRHTATHNIPFVLMKNLGPSQCRAVCFWESGSTDFFGRCPPCNQLVEYLYLILATWSFEKWKRIPHWNEQLRYKNSWPSSQLHVGLGNKWTSVELHNLVLTAIMRSVQTQGNCILYVFWVKMSFHFMKGNYGFPLVRLLIYLTCSHFS